MSVGGTVHDMRFNLLDDRSLIGDISQSSGVCSGCHTAHGPARLPAPSAADLSGHCTTCHQEAGCAQRKLAGSAGHPDSKCIDCHDPHKGQAPDFLRQSSEDLCRTCHADQYLLAGGAHDRTKHPAKWVGLPAATGGLCQTCHVSHGTKGTGLFRAAVQVDAYHDAICLQCHPDTRWKSGTSRAAIHPQQVSPQQKRVPVSLVPTDDQGNMRMGCRTCHNVHGGADPVHLARVKPAEPTATLCTHCHQDKTLITMTSHAPDRLTRLGFDVDSCKPCHAMHAEPTPDLGPDAQSAVPDHARGCCDPTRSREHGLRGLPPPPMGSPRFRASPRTRRASCSTPSSPMSRATCRCSPRTAWWITMARSPAARATLPTAVPTCWLPPQSGDSPPTYDSRRAAAKMQLRSFATPNLCTQCHGADARRRYLFFHNSLKRKPTNT